MAYQFANNATSVLRQDTPAANTTIQLPTGEGARFPVPAGGNFFMVTLEDRRTGQLEICQCTARSADILTVVRAQEGTTAQLFYAGCTVSNRLTAAQLAFMQSAATGVPDAPNDANAYNRKGLAWAIDNWTNLAGKPTTFTPTAHVHVIADVTGLQAALDAETNARTSADSTLTTNLATETSTRSSADSTLTTNLNTEITNRTNADTTLQNDINTRATAANLTTEITNRTNADTALQTNINAKADKTYVDSQDAGKVTKAGDTMTGLLTSTFATAPQVSVDPATGHAIVQLDAPVASANRVMGARSGLSRWDVTLGDSTAEGGSNAGSNFAINRYADAGGAAIDSPLSINRASGAVIIPTIAAQPACFAHRSGGGNVALTTATWTKLPLGSIVNYGLGGFTIVGNDINIPKTGLYWISCSGLHHTTAAICTLLVGFGINSTTVPTVDSRTNQMVASIQDWTINCGRVVSLAANDKITLMAYNSAAGGVVQDSSAETFIQLVMLGV